MDNKTKITRVTLSEAKAKKGKTNIGKILVEQQKEKKKKH